MTQSLPVGIDESTTRRTGMFGDFVNENLENIHMENLLGDTTPMTLSAVITPSLYH